MSRLMVGDRVRVIQDFEEIDSDGGFEGPCPFNENSSIEYGMEGIVRGHEPGEFLNTLVEFDDDVGGHSGNGRCEDGHGYWVNSDVLKLMSTPNIEDKKQAVLNKSKRLTARFNERKLYANPVSLQDVQPKCKVFGHKLTSTESST